MFRRPWPRLYRRTTGSHFRACIIVLLWSVLSILLIQRSGLRQDTLWRLFPNTTVRHLPLDREGDFAEEAEWRLARFPPNSTRMVYLTCHKNAPLNRKPSDHQWVSLKVDCDASIIFEGFLYSAHQDSRLEKETSNKNVSETDRNGGENYVRVLGLLRVNVTSEKVEDGKVTSVKAKKTKDGKRRLNPTSLKVKKMKNITKLLLPTIELFCSLVWDQEIVGVGGAAIVSVRASLRSLGSVPSRGYDPYLISCPYPPFVPPPLFVVVSCRRCDAWTPDGALRVVQSSPEKMERITETSTEADEEAETEIVTEYIEEEETEAQPSKVQKKFKFNLCVKGLDYQYDNSVRLVEWMEAQRLMGADHIVMFVFQVHKNMEKVLNFYVEDGLLTIRALSHPGTRLPKSAKDRLKLQLHDLPQKRVLEMIPYNDCFYRYKNAYDFIILIDTDELILPLKHKNWDEFVRDIEKRHADQFQSLTSLQIQNAHFFDQFPEDDRYPKYTHMLRHTWRRKKLSRVGKEEKSFAFTRNTLTVFNHFPLAGIRQDMSRHHVPPEDAILMHFKTFCSASFKGTCRNGSLENPVKDEAILRFAGPLIQRVDRVLTRLGILH